MCTGSTCHCSPTRLAMSVKERHSGLRSSRIPGGTRLVASNNIGLHIRTNELLEKMT